MALSLDWDLSCRRVLERAQSRRSVRLSGRYTSVRRHTHTHLWVLVITPPGSGGRQQVQSLLWVQLVLLYPCSNYELVPLSKPPLSHQHSTVV
eukprot:91966-Pyramimonas_sp.AAC.1